MKKVIICLAGSLLLTVGLHARGTGKQAPDNAFRQLRDTVIQGEDSVKQVIDTTTTPSVKFSDSTVKVVDSSGTVQHVIVKVQDNSKKDSSAKLQDSTAKSQDNVVKVQDKDNGTKVAETPKPAQEEKKDGQADDPPTRQVDTRWFIAPLTKFQFQDFGMLEKNRKGYLSDANTLPLAQRGNLSFAASAYKNITGRLSVSADLGLSFGHVTNDNVLISQTKSKTYNLLNATVYYHLLSASYRLQPYVAIGINDIINDASYVSAPMGIGAKFNAKKVMVTGQVMYGYALSKSISNTTMYSLGIYLPIKNKKQKKAEADEAANKNGAKNDTTGKKGAGVTNIYITINLDSLLNARKGNDGRDGQNSGDGSGDGDGSQGSSGRKHGEGGLKDFDLQNFDLHDFTVDTVDGKPVIKFVIYFEFNDFGLNSKAFSSIDRILGTVRKSTTLNTDIRAYADDVGTVEQNNYISKKRAQMVYEYMNSRGVPADKMKYHFYGKSHPVADNKDPNQSWLNRRAEIVVSEK